MEKIEFRAPDWLLDRIKRFQDEFNDAVQPDTDTPPLRQDDAGNYVVDESALSSDVLDTRSDVLRFLIAQTLLEWEANAETLTTRLPITGDTEYRCPACGTEDTARMMGHRDPDAAYPDNPFDAEFDRVTCVACDTDDTATAFEEAYMVERMSAEERRKYQSIVERTSEDCEAKQHLTDSQE